jgi:hypothetical protein
MMIALALSAWLLGAMVPFFLALRRWRWRWQEVIVGHEPAHAEQAPYREASLVPIHLGGAPLAVRLTAFSCLWLGVLALPLVLLAGFGLFFFGSGVLVMPLIVTAVKLYNAGLLLLRREPRAAYFTARNAAMWSLGCVVVGWSAAMLIVWLARPAFGYEFVGWVAMGELALAAQAGAVLKVTRRWEDALFAPSRLVRLGDQLVASDAA